LNQKFLRLSQMSGVAAGKSGETSGWETDVAALGVPGMGVKAMGPDVCLPLAMTVNLVLICWPQNETDRVQGLDLSSPISTAVC
jgi:hypothetical protein